MISLDEFENLKNYHQIEVTLRNGNKYYLYDPLLRGGTEFFPEHFILHTGAFESLPNGGTGKRVKELEHERIPKEDIIGIRYITTKEDYKISEGKLRFWIYLVFGGFLLWGIIQMLR